MWGCFVFYRFLLRTRGRSVMQQRRVLAQGAICRGAQKLPGAWLHSPHSTITRQWEGNGGHAWFWLWCFVWVRKHIDILLIGLWTPKEVGEVREAGGVGWGLEGGRRAFRKSRQKRATPELDASLLEWSALNLKVEKRFCCCFLKRTSAERMRGR